MGTVSYSGGTAETWGGDRERQASGTQRKMETTVKLLVQRVGDRACCLLRTTVVLWGRVHITVKPHKRGHVVSVWDTTPTLSASH